MDELDELDELVASSGVERLGSSSYLSTIVFFLRSDKQSESPFFLEQCRCTKVVHRWAHTFKFTHLCTCVHGRTHTHTHIHTHYWSLMYPLSVPDVMSSVTSTRTCSFLSFLSPWTIPLPRCDVTSQESYSFKMLGCWSVFKMATSSLKRACSALL